MEDQQCSLSKRLAAVFLHCVRRLEKHMKTILIGNKSADTVLVQITGDHEMSFLEKEVLHIRTITGTDDFLLAAVIVDDWNEELSPWKAPPAFGTEGFGDGAAKTLSLLRDGIQPFLDARKEGTIQKIFLGGYSLAGLFSLWAAGRADIFDGVAAVSPSVWFPGYMEYVRGEVLRVDTVYLSLGDKEEKTRNQVMSRVGDSIRELYRILEENGTECILEWNPGNHFREPDLRMAKGFAWLMKH